MTSKRRHSQPDRSPPPTDRSSVNPLAWIDWLRGIPPALIAAIAVASILIPPESVGQGTAIPWQLAALAALSIWILCEWVWGSGRLACGWPDLLGGGFFAWFVLSAVRMSTAGQARLSINMTWAWLGGALIWFLARQTLRSPTAIRTLVALHLALIVALSSYGFYQRFVIMPLDRAAFERDPDAVLRVAGIDAPEGSPLRRQYADRLRSPEPLATFALTNSLAAYLLPWLVICGGILVATQRERFDPRIAGALVATGLLAGICLLLTRSRSAYVGAAVGMLGVGGVALWNKFVREKQGDGNRGADKNTRWLIAASTLVGLLVLGAIALSLRDATILGEARKSLGYRWEYWEATVAMLRDYPLSGCGPGNFQVFYTAYKLPQSSETIADPHNFALEIAATAGWPALALFLAAGIAWLVALVRGPRLSAIEPPRVDSSSAANSLTNSAQPHTGSPFAEFNSPRVLMIGAGFGVILGCLAGVISGYPPPLELLILGGIPAIGVIWALRPWVRQGSVSVACLATGFISLLVCLLAAGGIGYPAVSLGVWLLAALTLNLATGESHVWHAPRWFGFILGATWLVLVVVFYTTCYRPVFTGRSGLMRGDQALSEGNVDDALTWYQAVATADPWWSDPWRRQAEVALQVWLTTSESRAREEFERTVLETIRREPRSQLVRQDFAKKFLFAYRRTGDRNALADAIAFQRDAVELYPNGAMARAQLAWLLHVAGDKAAAKAEAERALGLDDVHPHEEQKLENQILTDYPPGLGSAEQVSTRPEGKKARECLEQFVLGVSGKQ